MFVSHQKKCKCICIYTRKNCHSYQRKKMHKVPSVCQFICQDYITQCDPLLLMIDVTLCHLMSITIFNLCYYLITLLSVSLSLLLRYQVHYIVSVIVTIIEISICGGLILCCYDIHLRAVFYCLLETR